MRVSPYVSLIEYVVQSLHHYAMLWEELDSSATACNKLPSPEAALVCCFHFHHPTHSAFLFYYKLTICFVCLPLIKASLLNQHSVTSKQIHGQVSTGTLHHSYVSPMALTPLFPAQFEVVVPVADKSG